MADYRKWGFAVGALMFVLAAITAAATGLGWSTLRGPDVCEGIVHSYVKVTTIYYTVLLGLYGFGFLASIMSVDETCAVVSMWINGTILLVMAVVGCFTTIAWVGWGIAALTSDNPCKGTMYYVDTIFVVVLSGLSLCGNLCKVNLKYLYNDDV